VDAAGGTLTISDVRRDDEGNYVCVVNTTAQPIVTSTNAHLYVESEFYSRASKKRRAVSLQQLSILFTVKEQLSIAIGSI